MKEILSPVVSELNVKNSRFLAELCPVSSAEEARAVIKERKLGYADAAHVVHAFVVGPTGGILGCSDDGEPSGTAGRPALDVLKGSGLTDVLLTVTRWFGGTLLGTGGLVKAYGDSAKAAVAAATSREILARVQVTADVGYDIYEPVRNELCAVGAEIVSEDFAERVSVTARVEERHLAQLSDRVRDLSSGRSALVVRD